MTDRVMTTAPILERLRLDGRVALVTGGGQGIGRAFAHALGEAGAAVAVVDLVAERAHSVVAELGQKGVDALAIGADVTGADQVQGIVDHVMRRWGQPWLSRSSLSDMSLAFYGPSPPLMRKVAESSK